MKFYLGIHMIKHDFSDILMTAKVAGGPDIYREAMADAAVGVLTNRKMGNVNLILNRF